MTNTIIISRVSTEDQKIAGNSLPAQEKRMVDYCDRKGFKIIQKFSFDESAYKTKRAEFTNIIEFIKKQKGFVNICFDKVDRLSRNIFDKSVSWLYEEALRDNLEMHFVSDNQIINSKISAAEKFNFSITLGLAKYYSDAVSDNVRRANEKTRSSGIAHKLPEGYARKDNQVTITPSSELVSEAFLMLANGYHSQKEIVEYMNQKGYVSKAGKKISCQTLHKILTNPFYYGFAQSKYGSFKHIYPPLTTEAIFEKCQKQMNKKKIDGKKQKRNVKPYTFRNLLNCSECNRTINPDGPKKDKYIYYRCVNKECSYYQQVVKEETLLEQTEEILKNLVFTNEAMQFVVDKLKNDFDKESLYQKKQRVEVYSEIELYTQRKSNLVDLFTDASITKDDYSKKCNEYEEKLYELNLKMTAMTKENSEVHLTVGKLFDLVSRLPEIFQSSNSTEKNAILKYLISNSLQSGKKAEFNLHKPFSFLVQNDDSSFWRRRRDSNPWRVAPRFVSSEVL
jgi:site-specific DNA recombinase